MGFKLPDLTKIPIDGETCMAEELARIEKELNIDDANVWRRDDGGSNSEPDGLFWELRWRAGIDPTLHTADAVGIAFELGKIAAGGKADPLFAQRLGGRALARLREAAADAWKRAARPIWLEHRGSLPKGDQRRLSQDDVAKLIKDTLKSSVPKEAQIVRSVREWDRNLDAV
jgi:hypothetical protein